MTKVREIGTLQIPQDPGFQRKEWPAMRIGWVLIAVVIVGGALGMLGAGPLSDATVQSADGRVELNYDWIVRQYADTRIELRIDSAADTIAVWFNRDYISAVELNTILPEPLSVTLSGDRVWFAFALNGPSIISIRMHANDIGKRTGMFGLERGGTVTFKQLVLP